MCFLCDDVDELRQQDNVLSSNMSINRTPCQSSDELELNSGIRIFLMHTIDENRTNEHALASIPVYQNYTPAISVPTMRLGQISSSQPLTHYSKSLPLQNLRDG